MVPADIVRTLNTIIMSQTPDRTHVAELLDRGLYLRAYAASRAFGSIKRWSGLEGRLLAARLAYLLGAARLGAMLRYIAYRENRADPRAQLAFASALYYCRGPYPAWKFVHAHGELIEGDVETRAEWLALRGCLAATFRDFDWSELWHSKAVELAPEQSWVWVQRSRVLVGEDRYAEALDAAEHAITLQPSFPPAVRQKAEALVLLGKDDEALLALSAACGRVECGMVRLDLANLQSELGQHAAARENYREASKFFPLMERGLAQWLAGRRSDTAYLLGDSDEAREQALLAANPFHNIVARALADSSVVSQRVVLPVEFVRQHHMTCAPATLAAISHYWSVPADHLGIAEEICYDGTPSHSMRLWAESHGWVVREFTVDWASAQLLLDRGVPIAVSTVEPTNAHMQALVGYDTYRGTLLVRDPYHRQLSEFLIEQFFDRYKFCGPRGLLLLPPDRRDALESVALPDVELYDLLDEMQRQLLANHREEAAVTWQQIRAAAPEHRIAVEARRSLAHYDADHLAALRCAETLLQMYPNCPVLQLQRLSYLNALGQRAERLETLKQIISRPNCHPVFWQYLGAELVHDAREHIRAMRLFRRVLRFAPTSSDTYYFAAGILWQQRRFAEAINLTRMAACLDDKEESYARAYFSTARHLKEVDVALALLRGRVERLGKKSRAPIQTLHWALEEVDRTKDAFDVLECAMQLHPEDRTLELYAADAHARYGRFAEAERLLLQSKQGAHAGTWLRTAALIAMYRGERLAALGYWREVLHAEPQATDAHSAIVQLLTETEGAQAAVTHLTETAARWPHNYPLQQMLVCQLRDENLPLARSALRTLLERFPANAWAEMEMATVLGRLGHFDQALGYANDARQLDPHNPDVYCVLGTIFTAAGRSEAARQAYRDAIRRSIDHTVAVEQLVMSWEPAEGRKAELSFIQSELVRQVTFGDGLLAFRRMAQGVLAPEQLLDVLQQGKEVRPDLPQAWSALAWQLAEMGQLDDARQVVVEATARFPLIPSAWYDLAYLQHLQGSVSEAQESLRHTLSISPGFSVAARQLATYHSREADYAGARAILERAAAHQPLDVEIHGQLAETLRQQGDGAAALERVKQAIQIAPSYEAAWGLLIALATDLGQLELPSRVAEELVTRRPGNPACWLALANTLNRPPDHGRRMDAVERAIALQPTSVSALDLRARLLVEDGQLDDALAACTSTAYGEYLPAVLRARVAEIEAQRGNLHEAARHMRLAVSLDSSDPSTWHRLLAFHQRLGLNDQYVEVAQASTAALPGDPATWWHLALAELQRVDRPAAKRALYQAWSLAPDSTAVACWLCRLHMDDWELKEAKDILVQMRQRALDGNVVAHEILYSVAEGDQTCALQCLRQLCVMDTDGESPVATALEGMQRAGWTSAAWELLNSFIEDPQAKPAAVQGWLSLATADLPRFADRLEKLNKSTELWRHGAAVFVQETVSAPQLDLLRGFLRRHRTHLSADDTLWNLVGQSLSRLGAAREAVDWLADWPRREGVTGNTLLALADSLARLNRAGEIRQVHERGESLSADTMAVVHTLWLAADDGATGQIEAALARWQRVSTWPLPDEYRVLYTFVQSILECERSGGKDERTRSYRSVQQILQERLSPLQDQMKSRPRIRRLMDDYLRRIARQRGGILARLRLALSKLFRSDST